MDKKSKLALVSSTPHPLKKQRLTSVFDETVGISPISILKPNKIKPAAKQSHTLSKPKSTARADPDVLKKKKCMPKTESASSAALKEMGVKTRLGSNFLSMSRNMYNMFPQPIILDSDEETETQVANTKQAAIKKDTANKPSATLVKVEDVNSKVKLSKQSNKCKTIKERKTKIDKELSKIKHETPQPSCSRPRSTKNQPLNKLNNTGLSSGKIDKARDKGAERIPNIVDLDDESSLFPTNISSFRKSNYLKYSSLDNIINDNTAIKWTPRSRKVNLKTIGENASDNESVNSDSDNCKGFRTLNLSDTLSNVVNKENTKNKNNVAKNESSNKENSVFPKDSFSSFADLVFRPSKQSQGCVIAPSLVTSSCEFGFLELDESKSFSGKQKNITFVLLEGKAKCTFQDKSQSLSPGDILHIHGGSGYQFHNLGSGHTRLLYSKGKHST